ANRSFNVNNSTLWLCVSWLRVFLYNVYAFDDNFVYSRHSFFNYSCFTLSVTSDNFDIVSSFYKHYSAPPEFNCSFYSTSGARDTIFIKSLSRSSRATGPKIRVPLGVLSALII